VRGALADPAVGDGVLAIVEAGGGVQLAQFVVGLEGAVLVGGLAPRHADRGRDVAGPLRLLLRQVGGGEQAAGVLVGRAHGDQVLGADGGHHLVAVCPDRAVLLAGGVAGGRAGHRVLDEGTGVQLPLLAAAVEQLDVAVAVELEVPVGVCGEPVVVAAVEDHGVVVADPAAGQQRLELLLVHEVPAHRVLQVLLPVQLDGAGDVAVVIGAGVLVDFDEDHARGVEILLGPVGRNEYRVATHGLPLEWDGPRAVTERRPGGRSGTTSEARRGTERQRGYPRRHRQVATRPKSIGRRLVSSMTRPGCAVCGARMTGWLIAAQLSTVFTRRTGRPRARSGAGLAVRDRYVRGDRGHRQAAH